MFSPMCVILLTGGMQRAEWGRSASWSREGDHTSSMVGEGARIKVNPPAGWNRDKVMLFSIT